MGRPPKIRHDFGQISRDLFAAVALRELARHSLLGFMDFTWRTPAAPLIVGRHTRVIAERLDRALADLQAGRSTYLLITTPHRHGKSDLVARYFPPYALGRDADLEIMLATYGQTLSEELSRDARTIFNSDEYGVLFPGSRIDPASQSVGSWGVSGKRGKLLALGIDGPAPGRGASILVIDDYFRTREEAESELIRDKTWSAFTNQLMTRLSPVHIVIVMATRWHVDDLNGRIQAAMADPERSNFPRFEVIHFRAREADGTYLFPERMTQAWYEGQFATLGGYASAALLQGEPVVKGGRLFQVDKVVWADAMPEGLQWVRFWDLASTAKERDKDNPDMTAGVKLAVRMDDGVPHLWIDDVVFCQSEAPERNRLIVDTARADGGACWQGIESVAGYKDAYTTLDGLLKGVSVVHKGLVSRDKIVRAGAVEPVFDGGNVTVRRGRGWFEEFMRQVSDFPGGVHDDIVDAMTGGYALGCERWELCGQFGHGGFSKAVATWL